jgi:hypothetical protein
MPNRTICGVLEEMRKCYETRNFSYMNSLIEEIQSMANRMEAKLWDQKDFDYMCERRDELKREIKNLEAIKRKSEGS